MATNDFLPFAAAGGANVLSQSDWLALTARLAGYTAGVANSAQINKGLRQSAAMAAMLGQFINDYGGFDALDDGNIDNLETAFVRTLMQAPWSKVVATGTANAWAVTTAPTVAAYAAGRPLWIKAPATNTLTTVTINISGIGTRPLMKADATAPAIGDFVSGRWYPTIDDGTNVCVISTLPSDLQGVAPISKITTSGLFQAFVASGTYTIKSNAIRIIGVGGGGGGNTAPLGGGAGATVDAYLAGLTIGNTISIVIGAGGAGNGGTGAGLAGGNTVISSGTQTISTLTAGGGAPASGGLSGVGGTATGGQINQQGGGGSATVGGLATPYSPYGIGGGIAGNGTIVNGSPLVGQFGAQGIVTIQALG